MQIPVISDNHDTTTSIDAICWQLSIAKRLDR